MPIIVLKDKNVRDIIQNAIKKKAGAYRFLVSKGELREAENVHNQWKALTEIADVFGIQYKSIMNEDKRVIKNEKNFRIDMKYCLDLLLALLKELEDSELCDDLDDDDSLLSEKLDSDELDQLDPEDELRLDSELELLILS